MSKRFDAKVKLFEDQFGLENNVKEFVNTFVNSDFAGPVLIHGKWGSGKTTFINFVLESIKADKLKIKTNYFSLWKLTDTSSLYESIYKELFRKGYLMLLSFTFPLIIITSYLLLSLSLSSTQITPIPAILVGLISLSVLFTKYLEDKTNREKIFESLLKRSMNCRLYRRRLIVLDDIDRLSEEDQTKLYPILDDLICNRSILVILGDINKLAMSQSPFIMKVLNVRYSIETKTNSFHSWEYLINELNSIIEKSKIPVKVSERDKEDIFLLQDQFCDENRTIREANILIEHMKMFYFNYKINKANFGQFFIMTYIYSFLPRLYEYILLNKKFFTKTDMFSLSIGQQYDKDLKNKMEEFETFFPKYSELVFLKLFKMKPDGISISQSIYDHPVIGNIDSFSRYLMEFTNEHSDSISVYNRILHNDECTFENFRDEDFISLVQIFKTNEIKDIDDCLFRNILKNYIKFYFSESIQMRIENESGFLIVSKPEQLLRIFIKEFIERKLSTLNFMGEITNNITDISQTCNIIPIFTTDKEEQLEIVKLILKESKMINIEGQKKLLFFMFFYKAFYSHINRVDIDKDFYSILDLDDKSFVEFVEKNFTTTSHTLGSSTPNYHLNLDLVAFNDKYKEDIENRIEKIELDNLRNRLRNLQNDSMF